MQELKVHCGHNSSLRSSLTAAPATCISEIDGFALSAPRPTGTCGTCHILLNTNVGTNDEHWCILLAAHGTCIFSAIAVRLGQCALLREAKLPLALARGGGRCCRRPPRSLLAACRRPALRERIKCPSAHIKSKQKQRAALRGPALLKQAPLGSCFCSSSKAHK